MKKIVLSILVVFFGFQSVNANTFIEKKVSGYKIRVVGYDVASKNYEIKVVKTDDAKKLENLLLENNAITGVNGVFFCPVDYSWCNTEKSFTDSERYVEGTKYASYLTTGDRAVFGWTKEKTPFIYQSGKINMDDEDKIYYGVGNYPLILHDGKNMLEYYYDAGLIFSKLRYKATRNFICSDSQKKNIYFGLVYDATIDELAQVVTDFGCNDALMLDAGLSTAFMYNGKYLAGPNEERDILDAIAIERKGLNVKELVGISDKISQVLISKAEKKSKNKNILKIKYLENHIKQLDEIKTKIYEKYSTDIVEQNFVGETETVGYKVEINDLKSLKMVYLLNKIMYTLKLYKNEMEKSMEVVQS